MCRVTPLPSDQPPAAQARGYGRGRAEMGLADAFLAGAMTGAAAGLDEGILLLSLPNSWLYGESLCKTNGGDE